jgi:hypothetical protein
MGEAVTAELKLVEPPQAEAPQASIVLLQPNDLRGWMACEPHLARAIAHTDEWAIEDVREMFIEGKVGLILCLDGAGRPFGALCIEFIDYPKKRVFQVHLFGAEDHSEELWMNWIWPAVQGVARQQGCASIMGTGRDGWARKLQASFRRVWEVRL